MGWTNQGSVRKQSLVTAASLQQIAWTGDASTLPGTPGISTGYIYFCRTYVDSPAAANNMWMAVITAGTAVTNSFLGVYDPSTGNRLGITGDISSSLMGTTYFSAALTSTISASTLTYNKELWLALVIGSQTATPTVVGRFSYGTNLGMSSDYRMWMSNTNGYTTLPTTAPAMSAATSSQSIPFIALSS